MTVLPINNKNFVKEVLQSDKTVIIDFYADWCGPCKNMTPILEELSEQYKDTIKIVKINVEEEKEIATRYNVRSMPTFLMMKDGNVTAFTMGGKSKSDFSKWIDDNSSKETEINLSNEQKKTTNEQKKELGKSIGELLAYLVPKLAIGGAILGGIPIISAGAILATIGASTATLALGAGAAAVGVYRIGHSIINREKIGTFLSDLVGTYISNDKSVQNMSKEEREDSLMKNMSTKFFSSAKSYKGHMILNTVQNLIVGAAGVTILATTGGFWMTTAALFMTVSGAAGTIRSAKRIPAIHNWQKRGEPSKLKSTNNTVKPSATPSPSNTLDNVKKPSVDFKQVNDNTPKSDAKKPANDVAPKVEEPKVKDKNKLSK